MDNLIATKAEQMCLTGQNEIAATGEQDFATNDESSAVESPITDEDGDRSTSDKNSSTEDFIQLARGEKGEEHAKQLSRSFWKHFTRLNSKFALCRLCQRVISFSSTTHNLTRHLTRLHPFDYPEQPKKAQVFSMYGHAASKLPIPKISNPTSTSDAIVVLTSKTEKLNTKSHYKYYTGRRRSAILNYFTKLDDSDISCKVCKCKFSCRTSVSNLLGHRMRVHPHLKTNFVALETPRKPESESDVKEANEDAGNSKVKTVSLHKYCAGKRHSEVWNYFTKFGISHISCKICKFKFSCKTSTSNLLRHRRRAHPLLKTNVLPVKKTWKPVSDHDQTDPDNFDPLDYALDYNHNGRISSNVDSMVEDQDSKILLKGVELENAIPERDLNADEEIDLYTNNLKESVEECKIQIKEEILSEEEDMDAGRERLNLRKECACSPNKQVRLIEFLVPALNSEKYGKLLFWSDEPDVFFIKWSHKLKRGFSSEELAVFQDWDTLKGRAKIASDQDKVDTRARLLAALKKQTGQLKSELEGYKKFQLLHADLLKKKCVRKQKNFRRQKPRCQDLDYKNQHVKRDDKSKNRVSRTDESISYKETSDREGEHEEEKTPFKLLSKKSKTLSPGAKALLEKISEKISNAFSSTRNAKGNFECAKSILKPGFQFSKATKSSSSSTEKGSEVANVTTESGGQKFKLEVGFEATPYQLPVLPSPNMPIVEMKDENKPNGLDAFTNIKTQGEMIEAMIRATLPTLQGYKVNEIYNFLVDMGVENVEDLAFIEVDDLNRILKPVQSRKLIAAWRSKGGTNYSNAPNQTSVPGSVTFAPGILQIQKIT